MLGNARSSSFCRLAGLVLQEQLGGLDAEVGGRDRNADLDHRRLAPLDDQKLIDNRDEEKGDRRRQAKREKGVFRPRAAKAGHGQLDLGLFGAEPARQIEGFDQLLDETARLHPQRAFALRRQQPLALARSDPLALGADRLDAARQGVRLEPGHRSRKNGRGRADRREQHRQEMGVREFGDNFVQHGQARFRSRMRSSFSSLRFLSPSRKSQSRRSFFHDSSSTVTKRISETKRKARRRRETAPRR